MFFFFNEGQALLATARCLFQEIRYSICAQLSATDAREHDAVLGGVQFIEPCFENVGDRLAKRDGALLASFAEDFDMSARSYAGKWVMTT